MNQFIKQARLATAPRSLTEKGAFNYAGTGTFILDYFTDVGTLQKRDQNEVDQQFEMMWAEDPATTVKLILYTRAITRNTIVLNHELNDSKVVGVGRRSAGRQAYNWLWRTHPEVASAILPLFVAAGTWKDLYHKELIYAIDWREVYAVWAGGLLDPNTAGLAIKYLPRIYSRGKLEDMCDGREDEDIIYLIQKNSFALGLMHFLGLNQEQYRKMKSNNATAHEFQQWMSDHNWEALANNFDRVSGRALDQMVKNRAKDGMTTLERRGLTKAYRQWLSGKKSVNYTGYVYELFKQVGVRLAPQVTVDTINKQYNRLQEKLSGLDTSTLVALDASGSMGWVTVDDKGTTPFEVACSLAITLGDALPKDSPFYQHYISFDKTSRLKSYSGNNFWEKARYMKDHASSGGTTNFMSVAILLRALAENGVPVEDFPKRILVLSDGQFDPSARSPMSARYDPSYPAGTYADVQRLLEPVGLGHIQWIWWYVTKSRGAVPVTQDHENTAYLSGFDASVVDALCRMDALTELGSEALTPTGLMDAALSSEFYTLVEEWI